MLAYLLLSSLLIGRISCPAVESQTPLQFPEQDSYSGQQVLRCVVNDLQILNKFSEYIESNDLDMWSSQLGLDIPIDIRLSSDIAANIPSEYGCSVWIDDIQARIDAESAPSLGSSKDNYFAKYHTYEEMLAHVQDLVSKYPHLARLVSSIGKTHEGRDIVVVHITSPKGDLKSKKTIWMDGGIHAREWISSHVVQYQLESLLTGYGDDEVVTRMLDNIEFVISPHINPDGYEYSRTKSRMWRKNRRENKDGSFGVDLNRNYDVKWGQGGSSRSPASDTYMGPSAASEPEVQAVQKYISSLKRAVVGINFHSYSQLILRPYGFGWDDHPTEKLNQELGDGMRDAIYAQSGKKYSSERSVGLYAVTGGMDDWMSTNGLIGYTIELRDTGRYGFVLPADQILPTAQEIWEAVKFMGPFVIDRVEARSAKAEL